MNDSTPLPRTAAPRPSLGDALTYPLRGDALLANLALTASRVVASLVPVIGLLLHFVVWLASYRYALEVMAASGRGRGEPPAGWLAADEGVHRSHLWLQALILLGIVAAGYWLAPGARLALVGAVALLLPGALVALAVAQNLVAALNPMSWLKVAAIVGPGYLLLAACTFGVLLLQAHAGALLEGASPWLLAVAGFYLAFNHLLFALFRLYGTTLYAHAGKLGLDLSQTVAPVLVREREDRTLAEQVRGAQALADPGARAEALEPVLRRGGADMALHREYRQCLRAAGRMLALRQHAEVHVCELLALGKPLPAAQLATEALKDDADFHLPEAAAIASLLDAIARGAPPRPAAQLAANYRTAFPKRFDGLPLALRAAVLFADRLDQPERARTLLQEGLARAGDGPEAAEFTRLLQRLNAGLPLGAAAFGPAARPS